MIDRKKEDFKRAGKKLALAFKARRRRYPDETPQERAAAFQKTKATMVAWHKEHLAGK